MSDATPELLTRNLHLNKMPSPADACAYWHLQSTGFLSYILAHNIYLYVIDGKRKPQNKWELPLEAPGPELETKASPPEHFSPPPSLAVFFSGGSLRCSLRPWANPGPRSCSIFSSSVDNKIPLLQSKTLEQFLLVSLSHASPPVHWEILLPAPSKYIQNPSNSCYLHCLLPVPTPHQIQPQLLQQPPNWSLYCSLELLQSFLNKSPELFSYSVSQIMSPLHSTPCNGSPFASE